MNGEKLTDEIIGKRVTFTSHNEIEEYGEITSYNGSYIFVRFDGQPNSKACNPEYLTLHNETTK